MELNAVEVKEQEDLRELVTVVAMEHAGGVAIVMTHLRDALDDPFDDDELPAETKFRQECRIRLTGLIEWVERQGV